MEQLGLFGVCLNGKSGFSDCGLPLQDSIRRWFAPSKGANLIKDSFKLNPVGSKTKIQSTVSVQTAKYLQGVAHI